VTSKSGLPSYDLQPGEARLVRTPTILQTILGSCVSVTFWSERQCVGAMCHGVLPRCPKQWPTGSTVLDGHRYVDFSIRYLAQQLDSLGINRRELVIKVFGGGDVLPVRCVGTGKLTIGAMNCEAALQVLEEEGLNVTSSDLRGLVGRKLRFHTGTGEVLMRRLNSSYSKR